MLSSNADRRPVANPSSVVALSDKVRARVDAQMPADAVHMELTLRDGRKLVKYVEHALGSLKRPLTDLQLDEKFCRLCEPPLGAAQISELLKLTRDLPNLPDVSVLARATASHNPLRT